MIQGLRDLSHRKRLKKINLHSFETRRLRGQLTELLKWVESIIKGGLHEVLMLENIVRTRSSGHKLDRFWLRKETGEHWVTYRVVDEMDKLSRYVVDVNTIESFKRKLATFMGWDGRW